MQNRAYQKKKKKMGSIGRNVKTAPDENILFYRYE